MDHKAPPADERAGYMDFFSESHANRLPCVYPDGSISWPPDYSCEDAAAWRAQHGLTWPGIEVAHRQFDTVEKEREIVGSNIRYFGRKPD